MIILICGEARHGKDSIADYFSKRYNFQKEAFAKPIKELTKIMFSWTNDHVYGCLKDEIDPYWGISPRSVMQSVGTEYAQKMLCEKYPSFEKETGRNIWIKSLWKRINFEENYIVADYRFPHEYAKMCELNKGKLDNLFVIRVERDNFKNNVETHESESHVKKLYTDVVIKNNGTLEELYDKVDDLWENLIWEIVKKRQKNI